MSTPKTVLNIHPKVFTSLLVGLAIVVVGAVIDWVSPGTFSSLGVWAGPAAALATTGLTTLSAWLKNVQAEEAAAPEEAPSPNTPAPAIPSTVPVTAPADPSNVVSVTVSGDVPVTVSGSSTATSPLISQSSVL